jgi:pyrroloquinoline-quinone synthase
MAADSFLVLLEKRISDKHLLSHPFYQAWTRGELSLECLKEYAIEYYHHVKAFPCYLSSVHSHTEDAFTRKQLLQNLVDEEAGTPNHPDLWRAFALRLGATEEQLNTSKPGQAISDLIETFKEICLNGSTADGLAALYAYESQIPAVSESKIEGLAAHYNLKNPKDWTYFTVHIDADKEHAAVERQLLSQHIDENNAPSALNAAQRILDRLYDFLTSLCMQYNISCTPAVAKS